MSEEQKAEQSETAAKEPDSREQLLQAIAEADGTQSERAEPPKGESRAASGQESEDTSTTTKTAKEAEAKDAGDSAEATQEEAEAGTDSRQQDEAAEKPESRRSEKARERLSKGWQDLNQAKSQLKKERADFERWKEEQTDSVEESKADGMHSADEYLQLAKEYREEGEVEMAKLAERRAKEAVANSQERERAEAESVIQDEWNSNLDKMIERNPELGSEDSALFRGVTDALEKRPFLGKYPEGIVDAVEFVKAKVAAGEAEALKEENSKLRVEIDELQEKTSVTGGPPSRGTKEAKGFDDMNHGERREAILSALKTADDAGEVVFR